MEELERVTVELPRHGNDRALDNWRPLFVIAEGVGGDWPAKIRAAFDRLSAEEEEDSRETMLLSDIHEILTEHQSEKVFGETLVSELVRLEGRPWREWRHGKPMTQNSLAKLLRAYKIHPHTIRIGSTTKKGYKATQFEDAFTRYLPAIPPDQSVTTSHPSNGAAYTPAFGLIILALMLLDRPTGLFGREPS